MNTKLYRRKVYHYARIVVALFTGVFLVLKATAQPLVRPAAQPFDNRYLLVFDTSSEMKKRLPAVQRALDTMLAGSMGGQLQTGDTIGVWTFDREVHRGQYPLQRWVPQEGAMIASNIVRFVSKQHYSKKTTFDTLPLQLNWVVQNSDRLTVLVFCDGEGEIKGTPFDAGINRVFQQQRDERKQTRQPVVVVMCSQLGHYVGCSMNLPPAMITFPGFPPWPEPPAEPTNAPPSPAPPPAPPQPHAEAPPLIIIGTKVGTNTPPSAPVSVPPLMTNRPPPLAALSPTNVVPGEKTNLPGVAAAEPTNELLIPPANPAAPPLAAQTNSVASLPESSGLSSKRLLVAGAVFLVLGGALTVLMLSRSLKADHGSLITRSMNRSEKPSTRN